MLEISKLQAWYGESHILHGVDLEVREGEVVTLLGRNGAGKTTTLKAIMGLLGRKEGSIRFRGSDFTKARSDQIARAGIAYCPEERGVFATLNVIENLLLPPTIAPGGVQLETIYKMFPNLKERAASPGAKLSGGEQQMLAIAKILRTGARLLLLDEPTEGLAPVIIRQLGEPRRYQETRFYNSFSRAELLVRSEGGRSTLHYGAWRYYRFDDKPGVLREEQQASRVLKALRSCSTVKGVHQDG